MKAILVLDMPKDCRRCQLMVDRFCYGIPADEVHGNININERPNWCPLRPLPTDLLKIEGKWIYKDRTEKTINNSEYVDGWNDCLKEIEG